MVYLFWYDRNIAHIKRLIVFLFWYHRNITHVKGLNIANFY